VQGRGRGKGRGEGRERERGRGRKGGNAREGKGSEGREGKGGGETRHTNPSLLPAPLYGTSVNWLSISVPCDVLGVEVGVSRASVD